MARGKKHSPEQVVNLLRQIEVAVANGKTTPQACKEAGIVEQIYFRWRREYGGLQVDSERRRCAVNHASREHGMSERRACQLVNQPRGRSATNRHNVMTKRH
jgi:putative transposase